MAETDKRRRRYHEQLLAELSAGRNLKAAAAAAGISERTASRWLASHRAELLRDLVERATTAVLSTPAAALLRGKA